MLYNIQVFKNETINELTERQIAVNLDNSLSYFNKNSEYNQEILQSQTADKPLAP